MKSGDSKFIVEKHVPLYFCGKKIDNAFEGSVFTIPFSILPTKGKHDYETCDKCQASYTEIFQRTSKLIESFPDCCDGHRNLAKRKDFTKIQFESVPKWAAEKSIFTNSHITNHIGNSNWFNEITEYIDYAIESFGSMPKDCGEPLYLNNYLLDVQQHIKTITKTDTQKSSQLLDYINQKINPQASNIIDLQIILNIYEKWLNFFPFELNDYFGQLKSTYQQQIPLLSNQHKFNKYSKRQQIKIHDQISFSQLLIYMTDDLLINNNGATLYKKNIISDAKKAQVDLLNAEFLMKSKSGYKSDSLFDHDKYSGMIKQWLDEQSEYWERLQRIIKPSVNSSNQKEVKSFTWLGQTDEIEVIYNKLISSDLIDPRTEKNHFIAIFTGESILNIQKINWTGKKNQLVYFIDNLRIHKKIPISTQLWALAAQCFSPNAHYSQLKDLYENNKTGKPSGFGKIDGLFRSDTI